MSLALAAWAMPVIGRTETLFDAIALAYETNPTLRAERAELRSVDEDYVQAKAGFGPQVAVNGQVGFQNAWVQQPASLFSKATTTDNRANTESVDLSAVQPLYTFGATSAQVRGAAANVLAEREALRQAEEQLLQNVITAYVDVRRDRETIRILRDEIEALNKEFHEIEAKGNAGALGKTDVAQSEARLLSAQAQLSLALGRLKASSAQYLNAVGQNPGELAPEPDLAGMPPSVDQAFEAGDQNNPQLREAIENEKAAREKVAAAKAANGPTISIRIDAGIAPVEPYLQRQYDQSVGVAAVVSQPLFTSGINSSKIRQALEDDNKAQLQVEATRRGVVQEVAQAWDQLTSTRDAIAIEERQVSAETTAVRGNRVEEQVGLRSTIDLLNAELELTTLRVQLVQSRHDQYVAGAALLAAMGLLEARFLAPDVGLYDPARSLDRVKNRGAAPWEGVIYGIDGLAAPQARAPHLSPVDAGSARPIDTPNTSANP